MSYVNLITELRSKIFCWILSGRRTRHRKRSVDRIDENLYRAWIVRCGTTTGRRRVSLQEIAEHRTQRSQLMATSAAETSFMMTYLIAVVYVRICLSPLWTTERIGACIPITLLIQYTIIGIYRGVNSIY